MKTCRFGWLKMLERNNVPSVLIHVMFIWALSTNEDRRQLFQPCPLTDASVAPQPHNSPKHFSEWEAMSWNQFENWNPLFSLVFCEILLVTDLVHSCWGTLFRASGRLILFLSSSLCVWGATDGVAAFPQTVTLSVLLSLQPSESVQVVREALTMVHLYMRY